MIFAQITELHSTSPHNDSTGTHSMGTASTGSPINVDDDDASDYTGCEITNNISKDSIHRTPSNGTFYSGIHAVHKTVVRSSTDSDFANRLKILSTPTQSTKATHESHQGSAVKKQTKNKPGTRRELENASINERSASPKDNRRGKSLSNYLNKAKEGIKAVTSTIAGVNSNDDNESPKGRQSRSTTVSKSKVRSASVGANVYRSREHATGRGLEALKSNVIRNAADNPVMSPRSQLKHARQNLKKVNSMPKYNLKTPSATKVVQDENRTTFVSPSSRHKTNTFTVVPNKTKEVEKSNVERKISNKLNDYQEELSATKKPKPINKPTHLRARPLSVIENRETNNRFNAQDTVHSDHEGRGVIRRRSSSTKDDDHSEGRNHTLLHIEL